MREKGRECVCETEREGDREGGRERGRVYMPIWNTFLT